MVAGFTKRMVGRLRGWMGKQLVADVPGDIAACEFECKRPECAEEMFIGCERRRRTEALMAEAAEAAEAGKMAASTCSTVRVVKGPTADAPTPRVNTDA